MNIERIKKANGGTRGMRKLKAVTAALLIVFFAFGCAYGYGSGYYVNQNALWGALYGASIGAAIGSSSGHTTEGALYGALAGYILGGGLGFGLGRNNYYNNQDRYNQNNPYYPAEDPRNNEKYGPYNTTPNEKSEAGESYEYKSNSINYENGGSGYSSGI